MSNTSYTLNQQLNSVRLVSDINLSGIYFNGPLNNGVGATLTAPSNSSLSVDGIIVEVGDRILLANQTEPAQDGIYVVNSVGSSLSEWILQRSPDFQSLEQLKLGQYFSVNAGDTFSGNMYVLVEPLPTAVGSSGINFINVTTGGSGTGGPFLRIANNLSDLSNLLTSYENFGLGDRTVLSLTDSDFSGGTYSLSNPSPNIISINNTLSVNTLQLPSAQGPDAFGLLQGPEIINIGTQRVNIVSFLGISQTPSLAKSDQNYLLTDNSTTGGTWEARGVVTGILGNTGDVQILPGTNISVSNNNDGSITLSSTGSSGTTVQDAAAFNVAGSVATMSFTGVQTLPINVTPGAFTAYYQNNMSTSIMTISGQSTPIVKNLAGGGPRWINFEWDVTFTSAAVTGSSLVIKVNYQTSGPLISTGFTQTIFLGSTFTSQNATVSAMLLLDTNDFAYLTVTSSQTTTINVLSVCCTAVDTTAATLASTDNLAQGITNLYLSTNAGLTYQNVITPVVSGNYPQFSGTGGLLIDSGVPIGDSSTILTNSTSNNATYYLGFFPANSSTQQVPQVSSDLIVNPSLGYLSASKVSVGTTVTNANLTIGGSGGNTGIDSVVSYFGSVGAATAANFYSIMISKESTEAVLVGINKNTITNKIPANSSYISTYLTNGTLSLGRGAGNGLPNDYDILIGSSGNVTIDKDLTISGLTASSLVSTDSSKKLTSSVSGLSPTFTGLTLSGLSINSLVATDGSKSLISGSLSGDITTSAFVSTLATVNSNVGSFGSGTQVGTFIVNAKGLITAASNVTISGAPPTGAAGGDLSGTYPNPTVSKINTVPVASTTVSNGQILIGSTSSANYLAATVSGTTNQVIVTNGSHSITLSLPQSIATSSSPQFTGLNVSGLTASSLVTTDGSNNLASSNTLSSTVLGNITKTNTILFTSGSGTYVAPAGCTHIRVRCWGGGAGAGGVAGVAASFGAASGGGSGAYVETVITSPTSYSYSVAASANAGGAGGGNGTAGNNTTFDTITAGGGNAGTGMVAGAAQTAQGGAAGGTASGGLINMNGGDGGPSFAINTTISISGFGGNSPSGGGIARGRQNSGAGIAGHFPGGGGSGAVSTNGTGFAGGAGSAGLIIVEEYFNG